ncbi:MAG: acyltransferase [Rhodospirillales bacterium]|nr:acyltransferase [Acetobacter sp.]
MPWGWGGVDLFFVLSGFLITGILVDSADDPHRFRNFYVRRTLRIFPLYYAVAAVAIFSLPLFHWQIGWKWMVWPAYLGNWARFNPLLPGSAAELLADCILIGKWHATHITLYFGHFWTLCVEEQFYLCWPAVVFFLRDRRKLAWICTASVPLSFALRVAGGRMLPDYLLQKDILSRLTIFRLDALLLGGLCALLLRSGARDTVLLWSRRCLAVFLPVALIWSFVLPPRGGNWYRYPYPNWVETLGFSLLDVLAALLVLTAIQPNHWLYTFWSHRIPRWMGRLSYGAYIFHDIPHHFFDIITRRFLHNSLFAELLLAWTYTFGLAWLSFRFFETPFLNLKDRFTVKAATAPLSATR